MCQVFSNFAPMKLHIFNPDHDLALAANKKIFTAPHAGRLLRSDLAFLPALWADEGDLVLVDDIDHAYDLAHRVGGTLASKSVEFVTPLQLGKIFHDTMCVDSIHPWGWNLSLKYDLLRMGCSEIMLPTDETLQNMRSISSRRWAAEHLQQGVKYITEINQLKTLLAEMKRAVVKAPWSCSGRGVRYVDCEHAADESFLQWASRIIAKQGGVTVEPYYNKVKDFGMEFEVVDGRVRYCGLSLFQTSKSAYTGNVLASEEEKEEMLHPFVVRDQLAAIRQHVIDVMQPTLHGLYSGPFGVDMMVCARKPGEKDTFVNPCIELNLRRTMGHVALALGAPDDEPKRMMQVSYIGNRYHLIIRRLEQNVKD